MAKAGKRGGPKREGQLKAKLFKEVLVRQGCMVYPLLAGRDAPPHWPDNLLVHKKWRGLVEFKTKNRHLTMGQRSLMTDLIMKGQHVAVCRLFDDHTFMLEYLDGEPMHVPRPWIQLLDTLAELIDYGVPK